jgi:MFS family permease
MMMAGMVSMMTWFVKDRPLALGITSIIGGCGMFIFPSLITALCEKHDLNGCFLILGGVFLQCCVFAFLLRPSPLSRMQVAEKSPKVKSSQGASHFDFGILEKWKYDLFLASNLLFGVGYFPLMMFITLRAQQYPDITHSQAAFLLTVIGMANILGRLIGTVLLSRKFVNKMFLTSIIELLGGLTIGSSVFCTDYTSHMIFSVMYGLVGGTFSTFKSTRY